MVYLAERRLRFPASGLGQYKSSKFRGTGARTFLFLVNHLPRHAAVDNEIGAGDEARAFAIEQEGDDLGDVVGSSGAPCRMLQEVLATQSLLGIGHDPAGA